MLIADVGKDTIEERERRAGRHGRRNPGLRHQREERHGLEQYRLPAGVRATHQQGVFRGRHGERERHDDGRILHHEERMPTFDNREANSGGRKLRSRARVSFGEAGTGIERIERDEGINGRDQRLSVRPQRLGRLRENPLHFADLRGLQLANAIAELHGRRRLDKYRASTRRRVVHDPANRATPFAPHRYHPAAVPHRHRPIVHAVVRIEFRDQPLEQLDQISLRAT